MRLTRIALIVLIGSTLAVATAVPAAAYVETSTSNPVTAAPRPTTPHTSNCTVTLADNFPSNAADGSPQQYSGTLNPPAACPGRWAKVIMTQTISVSGRQYDRVGSLNIGGTDVYWGTTEEPSGPTPTTYSFSKDLTEYSALLHTPQPFSGGITNYTSDVYTGNYVQTVTLTYYEANRAHPAPATPDDVIGLGDSGLNPGSPSVHKTLSGLPRNITRAYLEVTLEGAGCDEQWFDDVPASVSAAYPDAGLCAHGPYREADITLDGAPVAAVHTFPYIYSGGIVPTLWRPIPAIGTFSLTPETVDVTPFVGQLVDGGSHDLGASIQDIGDGWTAVLTLLLYTDHHAAHTHGALLRDSVPASADLATDVSPVQGGSRAIVTTSRHDVTKGYVVTSAGRITTTVSRTTAYRNVDTVTDNGLTQSVRQSDSGRQTVRRSRAGHARTTRHTYSYPLSVDYSAAQYQDDQNFTLDGAVDMTRTVDGSTENVNSYGVLSRTNGQTTDSDGHSTSYYRGVDDRGRRYYHYLASNHGQVTQDVVRR